MRFEESHTNFASTVSRMILEVYVKKPWLAFLLSFLIAGAGFAYLGKWTWALLNLSGAIAVGLVIYRFSPDSLSMASTVIAAASQTARNAMQRELIVKLGTLGATHVHGALQPVVALVGGDDRRVIGVQVVGRWNDEARVLAVGRLIEAEGPAVR